MSQASLRNGANTAPSKPGSRPRLAVIGTGLGGLAAAWLLKQAYDVTVFERHARPGMGIFTVDYVNRGLNTRIDIPTRVFSDGYYPHLQALLRQVGVRMHATDHTAAYADAGGHVFFHYGKFRALGRAWAYPKGSGAFSAAGLAVARDSFRFFTRARLDMARQADALAQVTLGQYLDELLAQQVCGRTFLHQVLLPTLSVICTCDYAGVLAYPADLILDYLCSGVMKQGVLRAEHGVDDIVPRLLDGVPAVCGVAVVQIEKSQAGLDVVTADGIRRQFDHVVMAAQAQQSAAMLAQFPQYRSLLEQVPFESSSMLVHTDTGLLPHSRASLSPVTYHVPSGAVRPEVTVDLTKAFPTYRGQDAVFQTWNPMREPRPGCHLAEVPFTRPVVTLKSREAMRRLRALQRDDALGLWFCGAYAADRVPLLESAALSAVSVAQHLGVAIPWTNG